MELFSARFQEAAEALVQQCGGPGVILGTIPQPRAPIGFVEKIRAAANVQVVTLTKANRDAETIRIYQCLRDYVLGST
jgi:nucleoside-triphosphatase THEP1